MATGEEILGMQMLGGTLRPLPPNASKDEQTAVINDIVDRLNDQLKTQIFTDGSTKRFIQGYSQGRWPGGDFGIAISDEGDDVTTADFNDLIFAWDFTTNKQYIRGGTQLFYDPVTGLDVGQQGILPNGKNGQAWSKDGESVNGAFGVS